MAIGTSTITATQAATSNYCGGSIAGLLTVSDVIIVTKNGQNTTTNPNYVNHKGQIYSTQGVNKNGAIKTTK